MGMVICSLEFSASGKFSLRHPTDQTALMLMDIPFHGPKTVLKNENHI